MPGVQDNYSIDVTNRFGFAVDAVDSGSDDGIENVDPFAMINDLKAKAEEAQKIAAAKPKVSKKKVVATPPPTEPVKKEAGEGEKKPAPSKGGERGARRGGGRGDGRAPRGDRPPREQRQDTNVDGAPREDRPRRGGRGGGRGGEGGPRRGGERRTFDRKSADPRSSVKGTDKREGGGSGNWGTAEDDLKAQTEPVVADKPTEEAPVEGKTEAKVEEAKPEPEVEEKTMTLEEYRKSKKSAIRNPNAKQASAPVEGKKQSAKKEHQAKGRAARVEAVDFVAAPLVQRGGGRGGRGDRKSVV